MAHRFELLGSSTHKPLFRMKLPDSLYPLRKLEKIKWSKTFKNADGKTNFSPG